MRNLTLLVGLSSVIAVCAWACGSDVTETGGGGATSTGTGGGGGAGGASSSSSSSSSSSTSGAGGFENVCEEACATLVDCGAPSATCSMLGLDCTSSAAECMSTCIVDSGDCGAIFSLIGGTPDPTLMGCILGCDPCMDCIFTNCESEYTACNADPGCQAFVQCVFTQCIIGGGGDTCISTCATTNPGTATDAVMACAQTNCPSDCFGAGGGGGAGGGAGGSGGAGGTN